MEVVDLKTSRRKESTMLHRVHRRSRKGSVKESTIVFEATSKLDKLQCEKDKRKINYPSTS
jgi:uncharacterized protein (UPF0218 family)